MYVGTDPLSETGAAARHDKGFALIDLLFVVGIIGVLSAIALPRLLAARNSATSASAIASMRTIGTAELAFALSCGNGYYAPDLVSLAKPPVGSSNGFIGGDLGGPPPVEKSGYLIQMSGTSMAGAPDSCNLLGPDAGAQSFKAGADPLDTTNPRFFGTNALGAIYEDTSSLFATMPEADMPPTGHPLR